MHGKKNQSNQTGNFVTRLYSTQQQRNRKVYLTLLLNITCHLLVLNIRSISNTTLKTNDCDIFQILQTFGHFLNTAGGVIAIYSDNYNITLWQYIPILKRYIGGRRFNGSCFSFWEIQNSFIGNNLSLFRSIRKPN